MNGDQHAHRRARRHGIDGDRRGDLRRQSTLSRKLAQDPDDPRRFTVDDLERFIEATGDATVVEYLAAKYLQSDESRRAGAVMAAEGLLRQLAAVLPTLKPE